MSGSNYIKKHGLSIVTPEDVPAGKSIPLPSTAKPEEPAKAATQMPAPPTDKKTAAPHRVPTISEFAWGG